VQVSTLAAMRVLTARSPAAGDELCAPETLDKIVASLDHPTPAVVVAGCAALRALATEGDVDRHASAIVASGALLPLSQLLHVHDHDVKEAATRCLAALAASGPERAERLVLGPAGGDGSREAESLLEALCVNAAAENAPLTLRVAIARFFEAACAHGEAIVQRVVETDAPATMARLARVATGRGLAAGDATVRARASAFACLAQMAKHADDLAAVVADTGVIRDATAGLMEVGDEGGAARTEASEASAEATREAAAALLREVASKTPELAERVAMDGGVAALVRCLELERGRKRAILATQTLGYVADFKPSLAAAATATDGGRCLVDALEVSADSDASIAAAWALGCVARHGKESAAPLAKCGAIKALMDCYASVEARDVPALRERAKAALKHIVKNCGSLRLLDPLVAPETPGVILRHVLAEFADKLRGDVELRRAFVTSGGLMRLQAVLKANDARAAKAAKAREARTLGAAAETDDQENDDELEPILDARAVRDAKKINANFPADVVSYYLYC